MVITPFGTLRCPALVEFSFFSPRRLGRHLTATASDPPPPPPLQTSGEALNDIVLSPIVGPSGMGKTALACALAKISSLPSQCGGLRAAQVVWTHKSGSMLTTGRKITFVTWDMTLEAAEIAQAAILPSLPGVYVVVGSLEGGVVSRVSLRCACLPPRPFWPCVD